MKICALETFRCAARPNLLWLRVPAAGGLAGWGETYYLPRKN